MSLAQGLSSGLRHPRAPFWLVEAFIVANLSFLAVDIYVAHSVNFFARWEEWIPFYFSLASPVVLVVALALGLRGAPRQGRGLGLLVGWGSVVVGVAGLVYHLDSQFFEERTLQSLVYTAPFVAPLAYTGIGLLIILDRTPGESDLDWAKWVLLLAWGGFVGNFILSLADHAQNGFFQWEEWIGVVAAAVAVGFLLVPVMFTVSRRFLWLCAGLMVAQMGVGTLGFVYHGLANLHTPGQTLWDQFVWGAPIFAPLLFANLALLACIGLWAYGRALGPAPEAAPDAAPAPVGWG